VKKEKLGTVLKKAKDKVVADVKKVKDEIKQVISDAGAKIVDKVQTNIEAAQKQIIEEAGARFYAETAKVLVDRLLTVLSEYSRDILAALLLLSVCVVFIFLRVKGNNKPKIN